MKIHSYFEFNGNYYKYPIEELSPRDSNCFQIFTLFIKTNGWSDSFPMIVLETSDLCYNDKCFAPIEVSKQDFFDVVDLKVEYGK